MKNYRDIPQTTWHVILTITSQSFLFGYVFACINPCLATGESNSGSACHSRDDDCPMGTIYNDLNLSTVETSLTIALMISGAWIGSSLVNYPCEKFGRKPTLLLNSWCFIFGSVLGSIGDMNSLFIGRFLSGLGVGVNSVLGPMFLSEIASPMSKSFVTTFHQVCISLC
jgi:MFS family permease